MKNRIAFIILISCISIVCAQQSLLYKEFRYYPISNKYLHSNADKNKYKEEIDVYIKKAVYIKSVKNQKNPTEFIQEILNKHNVVVLPNEEIQINENGLKLNSNQILIFQTDCVLKSNPNNKSHFAVLIVDHIENVKIYNSNLVGERFEHSNSKGQWGMGIRIISSKNIKIINPIVQEMWGDGIYIGGRNGVPSKNIEIHNAYLDHNRRNALSITSADGVKLIKPLVANSNSQSPKAGIDIEANTNEDVLDNILIESPICFYNPIYGIVISLAKLPGVIDKKVNIKINNPKIIGGKYGIAILGIYDCANNYNIRGQIDINNLSTYYTAIAVKEFKKPKFKISINISDIQIFHKSKRGADYFNQKQWDALRGNMEILNKN